MWTAEKWESTLGRERAKKKKKGKRKNGEKGNKYND